MKTKLLVLSMLFSTCINADSHFIQAQLQLHGAIIENSSNKMQKVIVSEAVNKNKNPEWYLAKAILNNDIKEIERRAKRIVSEGVNGNAPVIWAALLRKPNAVKTLLECGVSVSADMVIWGLKCGDFKSALTIIRSGLDISAIVQECMNLCISSRKASVETKFEFIDELLNLGFDVNETLNCPSLYIVNNCNILSFVLDRGANSNHITKNGQTPLMLATSFQRKQAVEILLSYGADVNQGQEARGIKSTPLSIAINRGNIDLVDLLLDRGARY